MWDQYIVAGVAATPVARQPAPPPHSRLRVPGEVDSGQREVQVQPGARGLEVSANELAVSSSGCTASVYQQLIENFGTSCQTVSAPPGLTWGGRAP